MQSPNLSHLRPNERRAVDTLTEALRRDLDARLLLLAMFGSKARGDHAPHADIDFLVVTDGEPREMDRRISDLTAAVDLECGVLTNVLSFSRDRWADFARRQAAFWQNARRDGILLLRSPRLPQSLLFTRPPTNPLAAPDHGPEVRAYLASAWLAVRTAESQFLRRSDFQVVANRAYYAIFYAANAVLATRGLQRSKHPTVLALFRETFVSTGDFEPALLRDYTEAMKRRHLSDYDLNSLVSADFVRVGLEAAQRFVSRVERYLSDHGYPAD